jgi:hypothetical protein
MTRTAVLRALVLTLCSFSPALPGAAQPPSPTLAAQKAAIAELAPLVGHWKGEGWVRMGPGPQQPFAIEERVQPKLDGVALLVEGHGTSEGPEGETATGHLALAVITWDPEKESYLFQTHTGLGHHTDAELVRLEDGRLRWGFTVPGREIRYTIDLSGETWHEMGEITMDGGQTWLHFHDMTLTRVE